MNKVRYKLGELPPISPEELARIDAIADEAIDCSDIPPLTEVFWAQAQRNPLALLRLDSDIWQWLQKDGADYQRWANLILRRVMERQLKRDSAK